MNPIVVHVVRPYSSEQAYLNAEAWSIDAKGMLLIDVETLPTDTAVLFDVALADGQKPIRAEGRVVGRVPPSGDRPGGLKVRFKRFGAATKAFIERAVQAKKGAGEPERLSQIEPERPSSPEAEQPSSPGAARPSSPEAEQPSSPGAARPSLVDADRASMPELRASMTDLEAVAGASPAAPEPSGLRERVPGPVAAPVNREELLARLRQRRHTA